MPTRTVQPGGDDGGDEELGAVGVRAGVSHGQVTRGLVLQLRGSGRKGGFGDGFRELENSRALAMDG